MPYLDDGTKIFTRQRYCCMTQVDLAAFTDLLRETFPGIEVCCFDTGRMELLSSPGPGDGPFEFAIVSRDWTPQWGPDPFEPDDPTRRVLQNLPHKSIRVTHLPCRIKRFDTAGWVERINRTREAEAAAPPPRREPSVLIVGSEVPSTRNDLRPEMPAPIPDDGRYFHRDGDMQGYYRIDNEDEKVFIIKFFRLLGRFLYTNCYEIIDLRTKKVREVVTGSYSWCGPDAARLCAEDPNLYCSMSPSEDFSTWIGSRPIPRVTKRSKR